MGVDVRRKVVAMRRWKKPEVEVFVTEEGIGTQMDLDEFLKTTIEEMGDSAFVMPAPRFVDRLLGRPVLATTDGLLEKLKVAAHSVVREMKNQTARLA